MEVLLLLAAAASALPVVWLGRRWWRRPGLAVVVDGFPPELSAAPRGDRPSVVTGDAGFDAAVTLRGDPGRWLLLATPALREGLRTAAALGLSLEGGGAAASYRRCTARSWRGRWHRSGNTSSGRPRWSTATATSPIPVFDGGSSSGRWGRARHPRWCRWRSVIRTQGCGSLARSTPETSTCSPGSRVIRRWAGLRGIGRSRRCGPARSPPAWPTGSSP